jgi:hypothetical protein
MVAERLICSGIKVWFAEYNILLINYKEFDKAIKNGISSATHAIVFSNNSWAKSQHCNMEIDGLISHLELANIIEICVPVESQPHRKYPQLAGNKPIVYSGTSNSLKYCDVVLLLKEIEDRLHIPIQPPPVPQQRENVVSSPRYGVSINSSPLSLMPELTYRLFTKDPLRMFRRLVFRGEILGNKVTLLMGVDPFNSQINSMLISQLNTSDDRKIYTAYRQYAEEWYKNLMKNGHEMQMKGLHLVHLNGQGHMALTLKDKYNIVDLWERRYVISERHGKVTQTKTGEVILMFSATISGDEKTQLETFCKLTPYMDAIVESFQFRPASTGDIILNTLPSLSVQIMWVIAIIYYLKYSTISPLPHSDIFMGSIAIGALCADFLIFALNRIYRRIIGTYQPLIEDAVDQSTYERISGVFASETFSIPSRIFSNLGHTHNKLLLFSIVIFFIAFFFGMEKTAKHFGLNSSTTQLIYTIGGIFSGFWLSIYGVLAYIRNKTTRGG